MDKSQFTQKQLNDIDRVNKHIERFTWHHNAQRAPNNMQLIPTNVHEAVKHVGEGSFSEGR